MIDRAGRAGRALLGPAAIALLALAGPGIRAVAANGTAPTMLVLNKIRSRANLPGNLAVLDVARDKVLATIPVGREPHEVALAGDGRIAAVSNTGNNDDPGHTLSIIDVAGRRVIRTVELGALRMPHGLLWRGTGLYFTAEGAKAVGRYDLAADRIDWISGIGGDSVHLIAMAADGRTLFASERASDAIAVVRWRTAPDAATPSWTVSHWPVCAGPEGLDLSPDGRELWVGCRGANRIQVLDTATGRPLRSIDTGTKALVRLRFTRDGRHVLASDLRSGDLLFIDPTAMRVDKRISTGSGCEGILIAPDGRHAYVASSADNDVVEVDLERMAVTRRLHTGLGPDGMAWLSG